jgi:ABC-type Fe3+ transport system permease subunit
VLVVIILEFGFLVLTTESQASGRVDHVVWRSLLIAHAVGGVVLALGILRSHPSVRQTLVRGYEW